MRGACNCVSPRYPCRACGAGHNRWDEWPQVLPTPPVAPPQGLPTTIGAPPVAPMVVVYVDRLHERSRTLERGLRAIGGHLHGDGSGDEEIRRIIEALDVE